MASSFYGLERISTQTLMDILEVLRCNRSTARNDETMSALDFLKWHRATFQEAADVARASTCYSYCSGERMRAIGCVFRA